MAVKGLQIFNSVDVSEHQSLALETTELMETFQVVHNPIIPLSGNR